MPVLDNPRYEKFAQGVASGKSGVIAYEAAFECSREAAAANATRMRRRAGVRERIAELQQRQAEKAEMGRDELRKFLTGVLMARPSEASVENPLCELVLTRTGPAAVFPSKLTAAAQLAKLCGWNEEQPAADLDVKITIGGTPTE